MPSALPCLDNIDRKKKELQALGLCEPNKNVARKNAATRELKQPLAAVPFKRSQRTKAG